LFCPPAFAPEKTWLITDQSLYSKVFEKIIYERLLQHIKVNNILVEEQFGFRPATMTRHPTE
jgi:hypothetical protein